ncbi:MAG: AIR synthase-related protein [Spirochaetes bacterium]|nr:AIR synthase-related protein [Spirochaetota bacterium]
MMQAAYRIDVYKTIDDPRSHVLKDRLNRLGFTVDAVHIADSYLINSKFNDRDINRIAEMLTNPVTQGYIVNKPFSRMDFDYALEIGYLPGVTDNVAHTVRESIEDLLKIDLDPEKSVFTATTYFFKGLRSSDEALRIGMELHNPLIQRISLKSVGDYAATGGMDNFIPVVEIHENQDADVVDLDVSEEELALMAKQGIKDPDGSRRGPLALDMASMNVIKDYFIGREKRNPTDVELESIAQTWSEHCKHTIFSAELDDIKDGIYRRYIKEATMRIRREKGHGDFCVSVFEDNSGGIEFDDEFIISDKVETHNSPSALDPFGGAITGIVGVNRDAIGFGMAAKPVANRYGFCFASPFDESPLFRDRKAESKLLSPRRIMEGVIHGVNVGGNQSGIPTPQGFVYFDERYKGKPLVFVGTVGLLPKVVNGKASVKKKAMPGDLVVMIGGRVGRDGIHGATFSSEALTSGSPAAAVQIGDPITQKKLSDAVVKEARDLGLYNSITDNGAGGLSCSVAEMARESGGFEVDLDRVPLKYHGLSPWQVWVSESQERMTLAVPESKIVQFGELMKKRGVECTVIGRFNDSGRGVVTSRGRKIFDLEMDFLHNGLPRKKLGSVSPKRDNAHPVFAEPSDINGVLLDMISRLNTASFEFISSQYDHEVQGNSVIKPVQGKGRVNGNVSVIRPVLGSRKGVVLSHGLYPSYSDIDTYWMAACSIDTAVRNAVSAGARLERLAILDNFCWCDSNNPERLGELKNAAMACYDISVAYGTPFISGKDSMFNDFRGYGPDFNEIMISVPPTLLISSIGVIEDISFCQTLDFKFPGDFVYIIGTTRNELGGSEYLAYSGERISGKKYTGNDVPRVYPGEFLRSYSAVEKAIGKGLLSSSLSLERGGLAVALCRSAMGGLLGFEIELSRLPADGVARTDGLLFSESQGRLLVSVSPDRAGEFEAVFSGLAFEKIGTVTSGRVAIKGPDGKYVAETGVSKLNEAYRSTFKGF